MVILFYIRRVLDFAVRAAFTERLAGPENPLRVFAPDIFTISQPLEPE